MTALLQRFVNVRDDEVAPTIVAALYFFCILTALMVLRPAREALGVQRGVDEVYWLFIGTAVVTLAVNPVFGALASRFQRIGFLAATYLFFAFSLVGFYLLLTMAPQAVGERSGQVYYVWHSVFNLFMTALFWALMADCFSLEQSKRLFPAIAVGGTLGALFGPWLAVFLVEPLGTPALLLVAVGFIIMAVGAAYSVSSMRRTAPVPAAAGATAEAGAAQDTSRQVLGGNALDGFRAIVRSPYLLGICGFALLVAVMATFIYFTRLHIVAAVGEDLDLRTGLFARIDGVTQATTLVLQLFVASRLMKRFGVGPTMILLPLVAALGFIGLAVSASYAVLLVVQAVYSATQRALFRPARETLFTVLSRSDKYKSKVAIDTFVYRTGDVAGSQVERILGITGAGLTALASLVVPLTVLWAGLGLWLGRAQRRLAEEQAVPAGRAGETGGPAA